MKTSVSSTRVRLSRSSESPYYIDGFVEKVKAIRELIGPDLEMWDALDGSARDH